MVSVNFINLLLQRPMASNVSEAMRRGEAAGLACFVKFYFSRKCAFYVHLCACFPVAYNRYHKELIELQVEKCEVILSLKKI